MRWALTFLVLTTGAACTDFQLYGQVGQEPKLADKLTVAGSLCTDNPATRTFPVRILFLVDGSSRMQEGAPFAEHVLAMQQVVSQNLPNRNVAVGIVRYDDGAQTLISEPVGRITSGFSRDDALISGAMAQLRNGAGARDLLAGLSLTRSIITGDAFQAEKGPLSRTKYAVVHVTSGSPDPAINAARCQDIFNPLPANCGVAFTERFIRDLRDEVLDLGASELSFHTIHLESSALEGLPCDPRQGNADCTGPAMGLTCVASGLRADVGRCVELCDPANPVCIADPLRGACATVTLPDQTMVSACSRGETACFDGVDNDGDGQDVDCADPNYPVTCNGQNNCEQDCRYQCQAARMGLAMSLATGGVYERFSSADQLSLARLDLRSTQRLFVLKEFIVFNRHARATESGLVPDSDADGLDDATELRLGLSPTLADTDGDFLNDKVEHLLSTLGLDPLVPNVLADCDDPTIDYDGDSLTDCEEKLLGSDASLFDTDSDGFPDHIEFIAGTNVLAADSLDDLDFDGANNGKELRLHTDALSNDAKVRAELAYRYTVTPSGVTTDQRSCYDLRVSNVTLLDTLDRGFGPGINDVDIYFGQVPEGDLARPGIFHVAQVRVQYLPPDTRIPDTPVIDLQESDFVLFEQ